MDAMRASSADAAASAMPWRTDAPSAETVPCNVSKGLEVQAVVQQVAVSRRTLAV